MFVAYLRLLDPLLIAVLVACLATVVVGVVHTVRRKRTALLSVAVVAAIAAISLWPSGDYLGYQCAFIPSVPDLTGIFRISETFVNFWMYAALATALLLEGRSLRAIVGVIVITPLCVELIQFLVLDLGRTCASDDAVVNWLGGFLLVGVGLIWRRTARKFDRDREGLRVG